MSNLSFLNFVASIVVLISADPRFMLDRLVTFMRRADEEQAIELACMLRTRMTRIEWVIFITSCTFDSRTLLTRFARRERPGNSTRAAVWAAFWLYLLDQQNVCEEFANDVHSTCSSELEVNHA